MTPKLSHILIAVAIVAAGVVSLLGYNSCVRKIEQKAETQSNVDHGQALAHAQQAKASDLVAADLQAKVDKQTVALVRLLAERDALLRKLAAKVPAVPSSSDPASPSLPSMASLPDVRDSVIAKDAEVIDAQAQVIQGQTAEITNLVVSRDQWKSAYDAESRRATGLEIALEAQKHVSASGKWIGRLQGFAVGIGVGYLGAKR